MLSVHRFSLAFGMLVFLVTGCASPPYKFSPNEKSASLKMLYGKSIGMKIGEKSYIVKANSDMEYVNIPVGQRIAIGSNMSYSGYNVTYHCYPSLSFVPEENQRYVTDANVIGDKCYIELVKENSDSLSGLTIEKSIRPSKAKGVN